MKTSTEQLQDLVKQIADLEKTITSVNWTDAECKDPKMGEHIEKLEHYLDCALGRASGLVQRSNTLSLPKSEQVTLS